MKRRHFCQGLGVSGLGTVGVGMALSSKLQAQEFVPYYMPSESVQHSLTWMAYYASSVIWGERMVPYVKDELEEIARTISRFERVNLLVSPEDFEEASEIFKDDLDIFLIQAELDDFWLRDTGAVFVLPEKKKDSSKIGAIDFGFNGWGNKQAHGNDSQIATFMANKIRAESLETQLHLEGGALEVDGDGTLILTESCVLNDNRNPDMSKEIIEADLKALLGVEKIIWLKGAKGVDITDAHTDFYVRFIKPGQIFVSLEGNLYSPDHRLTRENLDILEKARDAKGRKLLMTIMDTPKHPRQKYRSEDFAASYLNFYLVNGGVIMPLYGDREADRNAKDRLSQAFPDRRVVGVAIDAIASGGGGIHCVTQQQPMLK
ncbi:agmatine deiminase family protein [Acetobacteraceae bacterium]|nr:agmatine deiminase family protein [Acetobacteraceae bacterium]